MPFAAALLAASAAVAMAAEPAQIVRTAGASGLGRRDPLQSGAAAAGTHDLATPKRRLQQGNGFSVHRDSMLGGFGYFLPTDPSLGAQCLVAAAIEEVEYYSTEDLHASAGTPFGLTLALLWLW